MKVRFRAEDHSYISIDPDSKIKWTSVTTFIGQFKNKFDAKSVSEKVSLNKKSKWYGMDPLVIQKIWSAESDRSMELGNWYHDQREADLISINTLSRDGIHLPIIRPLTSFGFRESPEQTMVEGIYPEHFVFLESAGICGQSDRVEVVGNKVDIIDYKTNKEIKKKSYTNWQGVSQKMKTPINHIDDCNYYHYALQLSLYMYIILRHNPTLKPGKLELHHVTFKTKPDKDKYGNPVLEKDYNDNYIVHQVIPYPVPYLKSEIITLLKYNK